MDSSLREHQDPALATTLPQNGTGFPAIMSARADAVLCAMVRRACNNCFASPNDSHETPNLCSLVKSPEPLNNFWTNVHEDASAAFRRHCLSRYSQSSPHSAQSEDIVLETSASQLLIVPESSALPPRYLESAAASRVSAALAVSIRSLSATSLSLQTRSWLS